MQRPKVIPGSVVLLLAGLLLSCVACRTSLDPGGGSGPAATPQVVSPSTASPSEVRPGDEDAALEAIDGLLADGRVEAGVEILQDYLTLHPEDRRAHYLMGQARFEAGSYGDAKTHFERAITLRDDDVMPHLWMGKVLAEEIERAMFFAKLPLAKEILAHFERAAAIDPQSVAAQTALARYHLEAPAMAGGSAESLRQHIDRLQELDPAAAYRMEARLHRRDGDPAAAERQLRLALAQAPSEAPSSAAETYLDLGILLLDQQRPEEALPLLRQAVALAPRQHEGHYRLAEAAMAVASPSLEEARDALKVYLRRHPTHDLPSRGEAWFQLGKVQEALGDTAVARDAYRQALQEIPNHRSAKQALRALVAGPKSISL
jgi:tetratricopeptide (TPR) repeat protein